MNRPVIGFGIAVWLLASGIGAAQELGQPPPAKAVGMLEGHQDIGEVRHPGSVEHDPSAGTYTVTGSGANMWADRDAFHFAWKRVSGDVSLSAYLGFVGQGKEAHRKMCLVFRQDLDADSAYVDAAVHATG